MHTAPAPATRVIKKLDPGRPGARRWAAEYGDAPVCVRYRVNAQRQERQTTVEIVVDRACRLGPGGQGLAASAGRGALPRPDPSDRRAGGGAVRAWIDISIHGHLPVIDMSMLPTSSVRIRVGCA